jgi:hypothetical protein
MDASRTVTANYGILDFTLSVNSSGASAVPIAGVPVAYGGTTNYARTVANGTSLSLTAPATQGNANFSNWSGCNSTTGAGSRTCNVTMDASRTVTANYAPVVDPICNGEWRSIDPAAHGQSIVGVYVSPGRNTQAANSIATAVRGDDNCIYSNWFRFNTGQWTGWQNIPGWCAVTSAPSSFVGAALDVMVQGGDLLHHHIINWDNGWDTVNQHTDNPGPHVAYGSPTTATDGQGRPWEFRSAGTLQYRCGITYSYQYQTPSYEYQTPYPYQTPYSYQYQYEYQTPFVDIKANGSDGPININWNTSANLSWTSANVSSCNASGDWSGGKSLSGSESIGNLTNPRTYNYTLTCTGGSASDNVQVILDPPIPTTSNVSVTMPNYCVVGPSATVGWDYSDPSGSPQLAY